MMVLILQTGQGCVCFQWRNVFKVRKLCNYNTFANMTVDVHENPFYFRMFQV